MVDVYNKSLNGYEKLQILRIINGEFTKSDDFSDTFKKFINESYHIENDFIFQLNPTKYDLVPEFIIEECDEYIKKLQSIITMSESKIEPLTIQLLQAI